MNKVTLLSRYKLMREFPELAALTEKQVVAIKQKFSDAMREQAKAQSHKQEFPGYVITRVDDGLFYIQNRFTKKSNHIGAANIPAAISQFQAWEQNK